MRKSLTLFVLIGIIFTVYLSFSSPIRDVDEPQMIIASVKANDFKFTEAGSLVSTHPFLGYFLYGLPVRLMQDDFQRISQLELGADPSAKALEHQQNNLDLFSRVLLVEKFVLLLFFIGSIVLLFFLVREFYSETSAFFSSILLAFSLFWVTMASSIAFLEVPQLFFVLSWLLFLTKFVKTNNILWLALAFVVWFLAIGIRLNTLYLLPAFIFFIVFIIKESKAIRFALVLIALLISVLSLIVFFPNFGFFLDHYSGSGFDASIVSEVYFGFDPLPVFIGVFLKSMDLAFYLGLISAVLYLSKDRSFFFSRFFALEGFLFVYFLSVVLVSFFVVSVNRDLGLITRYVALSMLPVFFYAGVFLERLFLEPKNKGLLVSFPRKT